MRSLWSACLLVLLSLPAICQEFSRSYPPKMEDCRQVVYKTIGDTKLELYIFGPDRPESAPAVVFFFGGGWQNGTPQQFEYQCRQLAKRGVVAITVDYRVGSRQGVKPTACVADARSAIRWVRSHAKELGIDPMRIAAAGGSAGGHIATCTAWIDTFDETNEPKDISAKPDALILFNPALVLAPLEGYDPKGFGTRVPEQRLGTQPQSISPAHQVQANAPPTIIFHGREDTTVPIESAEAFTKVMKGMGNRCELKVFDGQKHGFFNRDPFRAVTLSQADEFLVSLGWLAPKKAQLLGHWPLGEDSQGKLFDGRTDVVQVPDTSDWKLGKAPFTLSLWVNVDEDVGDTLGDLVSCYDSKDRRGFHLGIYNHNGVTNGQPNTRQVHFGIDNGRMEPKFTDHGRLGDAVYVFSMCVHDGRLYASTCHAGDQQSGRVFRWESDQRWTDLGSPDLANAISSLVVFNGSLYAASSKYRLAGSSLSESQNPNFGGNVYRLGPGDTWEHCGNVSAQTEAISSLVVFRGKLYASSLYRPAGFFRYEGGKQWVPCNTPGGKRTEAMTVWNDSLYATCYDEGSVFRYNGEDWTQVGAIPDATQTYGFAIHRGELYVSEWPNAHVFRYLGGDRWQDTGKLGDELEAMPLVVYNGKMYGGTLPLAEIYRYDNDNQWTRIDQVDHTPDVKYRRAWSMAVHGGRLFVGTLPSGKVLSIEAGINATYDRPLGSGWHHIAAVRGDSVLRLYVDGAQVAQSSGFTTEDFDLSLTGDMKIGFGAQDYFRGRIADVRLYRGELDEDEIIVEAQKNR